MLHREDKIYASLSGTALSSATYFPDREQMTVEFRSGGSYRFCGVSLEVFEGLKDAGSVGQYFNANIRGQYDC